MEQGLKLHDTMIFQKQISGACGANDAYWQTFEYMFVFSKGKVKTFNPIKDYKCVSVGGKTGTGRRKANGEIKNETHVKYTEYAKRTNVWLYNPGSEISASKEQFIKIHPAMFPEKLAKEHIYTWSNEGDIVYDPFLGSGTTAKMAIELKRKYIGSEINHDYFKIAQRRIAIALSQPTLF